MKFLTPFMHNNPLLNPLQSTSSSVTQMTSSMDPFTPSTPQPASAPVSLILVPPDTSVLHPKRAGNQEPAMTLDSLLDGSTIPGHYDSDGEFHETEATHMARNGCIKVRVKEYGVNEKVLKNKHYNRLMALQQRLMNIANVVHPDFHCIFIGHMKHSKGVVLATSGASDVVTMPSVASVRNDLNEVIGNTAPESQLIFKEDRVDYDQKIANPTKDDAIAMLRRTQNAKSLKYLKPRFKPVPLVPLWDPTPRPRKDSQYNWKHVSYAFTNATAHSLWNALGDYNHIIKYYLLTRNDVTKKSYLGMLRSLDMLAKANGEAPLQEHCDTTGFRHSSRFVDPRPNEDNTRLSPAPNPNLPIGIANDEEELQERIATVSPLSSASESPASRVASAASPETRPRRRPTVFQQIEESDSSSFEEDFNVISTRSPGLSLGNPEPQVWYVSQ